MAPGECWLKEVGRLRMNDLLQNAPCCPIAVVACYSGSSADDHHVCRTVYVLPESDVYHPRQMVVSSVRDYLRKMSEAVEKPPPSVRGSSIHNTSSTVSALTGYGNHLLMLIVPRNGWLSPRWVNYFGQHNSKMGMNQRGRPNSNSVQLSMGRLKSVNN